MRPADLLRRTSFRLVVGVALLTLSVLIVASAIGYHLMRGQLTQRQDARITEIFSALQRTSLAKDEQDLVEAVTTRIASSPDRSSVYLLKNAEGLVLAANVPDGWVKPGWSVEEATRLGVNTDYPYRVFSGPVADYTLMVGLTNADIDDLAEIVLAAFGWSSLFALIVAVAAGTVIARRIEARISLLDATLQRVAQGDLSARLPVTDRGDDLDQIARAINQAITRLGALVEAMRQVSADIAHDLRTPLNRLRIRLEEAATTSERGLAISGDLEAALAECDTINQTFSALLRIAEIEAGARREKFALVDLSALLDSMAEVYAEVAMDAGMTLTCASDGPANVDGDRDLLTQMLANLIENAIRHGLAGTAISCSVDVGAGGVVMTVVDTGPGIPVAERDKVLRRLYRLEDSRTTRGSGLGLSLVKAVADLHHATVTLSDTRDEPPLGLRIQVGFPRTS